MPQFDLLWTDILLFILIALMLLFGFVAARHEHLRAPWSQVLRSRTGLATLVVLLIYLSIALLDSIHFHPQLKNQSSDQIEYSNELLSVFDWVVTPLRTQHEKTYSAPFTAFAFSQENIELATGETVRDFPRLIYGGAHLQNPEQELSTDVLLTGLLGCIKGLMALTLLTVLLLLLLSRRHQRSFVEQFMRIYHRQSAIPWHVLFYTLGIFLLLVGGVIELSAKYHVLGTDKVGEDVLYQALKSVRTGLMIGTLTTLVMLPAAVVLGIMAGYFRGWVDDVIQYLYTTLSSVPGVLLIAASILMLQIYMSNHPEEFNSLVERADLRLLFLCLILGITSWTGLCRLLRGEAIKLREMDYVQASSAFGVSHFMILKRHVLPNVLHIIMITLVLDFSGLVLAEAVLSYVNIGVDPTMNSWGNMINSARLEMAREPIVWWSLMAALGFMLVLVLSANLFSDVVRDAFDPRLRQR